MSIGKRQIGDRGESLAVDFLKKKKYKILERNFYTPVGEIDIVARDKKQLVFIEVKMNQGNKFGLPEERFDYHKKRKLMKAVRAYLLERGITSDNWRIDLIAVNAANSSALEIRHYSGVDLIIKNY